MAKPYPYIVCFGGEDYFLDLALDDYRKWKGREVTLLDGEEVTGEAFIDACGTVSFENFSRVVILDNANKLKASKELTSFLSSVSSPDLTVVAICRTDKLPAMWGPPSKLGTLKEFAKLKTYSNNNEVVKWIVDEAKSKGLQLSLDLAEKMSVRVGYGLRRLSNELSKLAIYVGPAAPTVQDIVAVCVPTPNSDARIVCDKTFRKELVAALSSFALLCHTLGENACIVPLVALFQSQLEKLVMARSLLDSGMPEKEIGPMMEMNPWVFSNTILPMVRKYRLAELIRHMKTLCELERNVKGASSSKRTSVELAILSIAQ